MKQNYIVPSTEVCEMEVMNIIAASIPMGGSGESANPDYEGGGDVKGENLWDTEW